MFPALRCLAERVIPSSPDTAIPFSANYKVSGRVTAFNSRPCEGHPSTSSNRLKLSSQTRHALWNRAALRNSRSSVAFPFILSVRPLIDSSCTSFPHAQACRRLSAAQIVKDSAELHSFIAPISAHLHGYEARNQGQQSGGGQSSEAAIVQGC